VGIITRRQLTNFLTSYKLTLEQPITKAIIKEYKKVDLNNPLKYLSKAFNRHTHVLVTSNHDKEIKFFITKDSDLLDYYIEEKKI